MVTSSPLRRGRQTIFRKEYGGFVTDKCPAMAREVVGAGAGFARGTRKGTKEMRRSRKDAPWASSDVLNLSSKGKA
jgi:hypothetical protein